MEAELVFFLPVPSLELAQIIAKEALIECYHRHPGRISLEVKAKWFTKSSRLEIPIVARCASVSEVAVLNEDYNPIFRKHMIGHGFNPADYPSSESINHSKKKWWKF